MYSHPTYQSNIQGESPKSPLIFSIQKFPDNLAFMFGFVQVKGLPFNRYSWLTTHNSFARTGEKSDTGASILVAPTNQEDTVTSQLNVSSHSFITIFLKIFRFRRFHFRIENLPFSLNTDFTTIFHFHMPPFFLPSFSLFENRYAILQISSQPPKPKEFFSFT